MLVELFDFSECGDITAYADNANDITAVIAAGDFPALIILRTALGLQCGFPLNNFSMLQNALIIVGLPVCITQVEQIKIAKADDLPIVQAQYMHRQWADNFINTVAVFQKQSVVFFL